MRPASRAWSINWFSLYSITAPRRRIRKMRIAQRRPALNKAYCTPTTARRRKSGDGARQRTLRPERMQRRHEMFDIGIGMIGSRGDAQPFGLLRYGRIID